MTITVLDEVNLKAFEAAGGFSLARLRSSFAQTARMSSLMLPTTRSGGHARQGKRHEGPLTIKGDVKGVAPLFPLH